MGLLNKLKNLEGERKMESYTQDKPRYFFFKSLFASFLEKVHAEYGAFLVKHAGVFNIAFPIGIDSETFRLSSFDASFVSIDNISSFLDSFVILKQKECFECDASFFENTLLYSLDDGNCVFLLLKFDESPNVLFNDENKNDLICEVENFQKEYKNNRILIETCVPPFLKYVGSSSIESKLEGSLIASTIPNFIKFSFKDAFEISDLHSNLDSLVLFYSIVNRISSLIGRYSFAVLEKDLSLNVCIFSSQKLDKNVYGSTLKALLSSMYGFSLIERIGVDFHFDIKNAKEEIEAWVGDAYNPHEI